MQPYHTIADANSQTERSAKVVSHICKIQIDVETAQHVICKVAQAYVHHKPLNTVATFSGPSLLYSSNCTTVMKVKPDSLLSFGHSQRKGAAS